MSLFSTETLAGGLAVNDAVLAGSVVLSATCSALLLRGELRRKEKLHQLRDVFTATARKKPHQLVPGLALLSVLAGLACAKLVYMLNFFDEFMEAPLFIMLSPRHMVNEASLPGAFAVTAIAGTLKGFRPLQWLDALTPAILLYTLLDSVLIHSATLWFAMPWDGEVSAAIRIVPYAVVLNLLLFLIAWFLRKAISAPGILFACYLVFSAIMQLHAHFKRTGEEIDDPVFSTTGLIALCVALAGVLLLYLRTRMNRFI